MKKLLTFLILSTLRQRVYQFKSATDAAKFAVMHEGIADLDSFGNWIVII